MIRVFTSKTQQIGELGENLAVRYLKSKGFSIIERNFTLKQGEIDIIAKKSKIIYFFEVKSSIKKLDVSHETYNPAENMHPKKIERFLKAVEMYIMNNDVSCETEIKLLSVLINQEEKTAKVEILSI